MHVPSDLSKPIVMGEPYNWDMLPGHVQLSIAKSAALDSRSAYMAYCKSRNRIRSYIHPVYLARMLSYARNRRDPHHRIADKWLALQPCDSDLAPVSEEHSFLYESKRVYYRVLSYGLVTYNRFYQPMPGMKPLVLSEMFDVQVRVPVDWNRLRFPSVSWLLMRSPSWTRTRTSCKLAT